MRPYPKTKNVWKRNPDNPRSLVFMDWADPVFRYLKDCQWHFTEKVHGTNIRVIVSDRPPVTVMGRTDKADLPGHIVDAVADAVGWRWEALHQALGGPGCLYGEAYGHKIQKEGKLYRSPGHGFVLFDVLRAGHDRWWTRDGVEFIGREFGIDVVPHVETCTLFEMAKRFHRGIGIKSKWGNFLSEGVIGKPLIPLSVGRSRVVVKIKSRDFGMNMGTETFE